MLEPAQETNTYNDVRDQVAMEPELSSTFVDELKKRIPDVLPTYLSTLSLPNMMQQSGQVVDQNSGERVDNNSCRDVKTIESAIECVEDNTPSNLTLESELVQDARTDPAAFGSLYERYIDRIYAYIYNRVGNVQDTEDLTARTFYRALNRLDTYEDRGYPFSAWLFRIAHNLVANWHRDRRRRQFLSLDKLWWQNSPNDSPEKLVEKEESHAELWDAIERLPVDRQNLLLHKFSDRLSNLEIGELMNKSEGAIKSLYSRTLAALRHDLQNHGWGTATSDIG